MPGQYELMRPSVHGRSPSQTLDHEARLLVVDDDPAILELLSGSLRLAGFEVVTALSGAGALQAAMTARPDLVLLDVMLPDWDGFEIARQLGSRWPRVPVIFLTARSSVLDRVAGLALGGEDYIAKPFSLDEVLARVRAVLRRRMSDEEPVTRLVVGDLELDESSHEVRRAGRLVDLTVTEFKLLQYLMLNAGQVLSKKQILDQVWGYRFSGESTIVESYISCVRRKIDDGGPRLIQTIRGMGYILRIPPP